jgi:hypothetical protein
MAVSPSARLYLDHPHPFEPTEREMAEPEDPTCPEGRDCELSVSIDGPGPQTRILRARGLLHGSTAPPCAG